MSKDKAVWMFAGGNMQRLLCQRIKEWGYKVILTDQYSGCALASEADAFVELDTFNWRDNISRADKLSCQFDIQGVVTTGADCHQSVARVAKHLGLHGLDPEIADKCRFKHFTREILTRAGIRQPQTKVVSTVDDARIAVKELGGKAAVKSTDNSGSRGFSAVESPDEVSKDVFDFALENGSTGNVIVESLLEPIQETIAEQSIETVWHNGKMYWLNWVDRVFGKDCAYIEPLSNKGIGGYAKGVEVGHVNPAMHHRELKIQVMDLMYRAGTAIGMSTQKGGHILKADIMLTSKGPVIIELTPRLSGGWDSSGSTPARGGDFVGGALGLALQREWNVDFWFDHFEMAHSETVAAVIAHVKTDAKDCIGREFAIGTGFTRDSAIEQALEMIQKGQYNVSVEQ